MPTLELEIIGPVAIGGKRPGERFTVPADADGVPTELYWRRRLNDERLYNCGAVAVVVPPAVPAEPPAAETPQPEDPPSSASVAAPKTRKA